MAKKQYVGELVRAEIKNQHLKNGYVIAKLKENHGIPISESSFSNKIYGKRDVFKTKEVEAINKILGTKFESTYKI